MYWLVQPNSWSPQTSLFKISWLDPDKNKIFQAKDIQNVTYSSDWQIFYKMSFLIKDKHRWNHSDHKCFFQSSVVLNQPYIIISIFPDFTSKCRIFLTQSKIPWLSLTLNFLSMTISWLVAAHYSTIPVQSHPSFPSNLTDSPLCERMQQFQQFHLFVGGLERNRTERPLWGAFFTWGSTSSMAVRPWLRLSLIVSSLVPYMAPWCVPYSRYLLASMSNNISSAETKK